MSHVPPEVSDRTGCYWASLWATPLSWESWKKWVGKRSIMRNALNSKGCHKKQQWWWEWYSFQSSLFPNANSKHSLLWDYNVEVKDILTIPPRPSGSTSGSQSLFLCIFCFISYSFLFFYWAERARMLATTKLCGISPQSAQNSTAAVEWIKEGRRKSTARPLRTTVAGMLWMVEGPSLSLFRLLWL